MKPVAKHLFASSVLRGAQGNAALTAILLAADDFELTSLCLKWVDEGSARIDERLVLNLYRACDRKGRLALASSVAASRMRPSAFRRVFDEVYARSDLTVQERRALIWNLECFLVLNPRHLMVYAAVIQTLLRSSSPSLRHRALSLAGRLNRLDSSALAILARHLRSRTPELRLNALDGFFQLVDRIDEVAPHIREFLSAEPFRAQVARMHQSDPDNAVRHNAWAVLQRLRRTLAVRAGAGRPEARARTASPRRGPPLRRQGGGKAPSVTTGRFSGATRRKRHRRATARTKSAFPAG